MPEQLRPGGLDRPHRSRLPETTPKYDEIIVAHRTAMELGLSTYRDPLTGAVAMTAGYLAERGYCCNTGCRHCPYLR